MVDAVHIPSDALTVLRGEARGVAWLVEFEFTSGTYYYTTAPVDIKATTGQVYQGLSGNLQIEDITESGENSTDTINISTTVVDTGLLALLIGSGASGVSTYRNRRVRVKLQILNQDFKPIGAPIWRWTGVMNPIKVQREKIDIGDGQTAAKIELPCQRIGLAKVRSRLGVRVTHAQQQLRFSGDMGFEYLQDLVTAPPPWLTVEFQKI